MLYKITTNTIKNCCKLKYYFKHQLEQDYKNLAQRRLIGAIFSCTPN